MGRCSRRYRKETVIVRGAAAAVAAAAAPVRRASTKRKRPRSRTNATVYDLENIFISRLQKGALYAAASQVKLKQINGGLLLKGLCAGEISTTGVV